MVGGFADLESLSRPQLLAMAHEYMLSGFHAVKAQGATLAMRGGLDEADSTAVSIDQWMGASPVYTRRMRQVMGIEGDDVPAIMKGLQLDVGFCHEYMDVAYKVTDRLHGEFWLLHCGALMDVEPLGEQMVFNMCHTIEDPTFDATALATNPQARIRPVHRPPRVPADRHPHCHWTLIIDETNDPVGPIPLTERIATLPLVKVPNQISGRGGYGRADYRGEFDPGFKLREFTNGALAAAAREFQMQTHLLASSLETTITDRIGQDASRAILGEAWLGASWIFAERLAHVIALGEGAPSVGEALRLTPLAPPGFDRRITVDGNRVSCSFEAIGPGLVDPDHPGWCGSLTRGADGLVTGTAGGLGFEATDMAFKVVADRVCLSFTVAKVSPERTEPDVVALSRIGATASWKFDLSDPARQ